jgi:peptidoglycan hydrolase CwlO-like protein
MALVTLTFTTTANADKYKLKVCERAEMSFWDTIQNTYSSADHSFVDSLDATNQLGYFKMAKSKIEKSMDEVRKRCKTTEKDIIAAYEKKISKIEEQLSKVNDL